MRATVVLVHAHPDDETLLTGGTIARLSAAGHRTVVVTATDGGSGLTGSSGLGGRRLDDVRGGELERACAVLGVERVVRLGHPDSGLHDDGPPDRFSALPVADLAAEIADILRQELPDAVTVYDPAGGYGHPDHRQVHRAGMLAAQLTRTPVVLQATVDRRALSRALRTIDWLPGLPAGFHAAAVANRFVAHDRLTHRVDVRAHVGAKRAAMAAHLSQQSADSGDRTLAWALRLPRPVFRAVFGHEWFVEVGRAPSRPLLDDPIGRLGVHGHTWISSSTDGTVASATTGSGRAGREIAPHRRKDGSSVSGHTRRSGSVHDGEVGGHVVGSGGQGGT